MLKLTETRRSLPISLLRTRELIMEEFRPVLSRHGITEQQWRVLRVLGESDSAMDATTVANRSCLRAPSLTRILRTLSDNGLVETMKDSNDGRRILVNLTPAGAAFIDRVTPESLQVFARLRQTVGDERWDALVTLLGDIRNDINRARQSD